MKLAALLTAIANVLRLVLEAVGRYEIKKQREDYEDEVESVRTDPIAHANRLYADNGDPESLSSDYAEDPEDRAKG